MKALTELKVADLLKECDRGFEDMWNMINKRLTVLKRALLGKHWRLREQHLVC